MFSAVAEQIGLDYETAVKVSAGFGGGMYLGSVCGAVTGGIMTIGCKYGGTGMPLQLKTAKLDREFAARFKAAHGSINCTDLLGGMDLSKFDFEALANDPDAIKAAASNKADAIKAAASNKAFANCLSYVRDAARIVNDLVTAGA